MALRAPTTIDRFAPALKAALEAVPALVETPVTDGIPAPGTFGGDEWIALLDVEFEQEARLDRSSRPRRETYRQKLLISVTRAGQETQAAANARAWELFSAVDAAIRDNPSLDGYFTGDGQLASVQVSAGTFSKRATDTVREATLELELAVLARI